jgi:hypothetical protein
MLSALGTAVGVFVPGLADGGAVTAIIWPIGLVVGTAVLGVLVTGLAEGGAVAALICPTGLAVGLASGMGAITSVNPVSKIRR